MLGFHSMSAWLGGTLSRKFLLLLFGFLALQLAQIAVGIFGVLHVGQESGYINQIGKQRARTLLLGNLVRQAVNAGGWQHGNLALFESTVSSYERFLSRKPPFLADLGEMQEHDRLRAEVHLTWEKNLRPLLHAARQARGPVARAALARYETLAPEQMARLDRLVTLHESNVYQDSRTIALAQAVILGLSLVLGIVGLVMARHLVSRPLRRLIDATRAIAAGAYYRRIVESSRDEIGQLARTFNEMVAAVEQKTLRTMSFNQVAVAITSSLSVSEIVEQILHHGIGLSGMYAVGVAFYDEDKGQFAEWFTRGLSGRFTTQMAFRPGGLADEVFGSSDPVLCSDHPLARHRLSELARDEGIRSYLCLPLASHTARLGVLCFYRTDADLFTSEESHLLSAFARVAAQAIDNARLHARTEDMAVTDPLTGLHNRRWLDGRLREEIQRSQRFGKPLSVLMLDVDHFKRINDRHGHPAGDSVLRRLAEVVEAELREVDMAARYGGEEIVIMLPETEDMNAEQGAQRIRQAVAGTSFRLPDGSDIGITVSIGVGCYPGCAANAEELIARADQALYVAKQSGRNAVALYSDILTAQIEKNPNRIVELLQEDVGNIPAIVTAVAAKALFYRGHTGVVEQTALRLAEALALSPEARQALRLASELHDIGMAAVPEIVLNKTTGLTEAEGRQIRQHPAIAAQLLEQVPALRHIVPIVRHHHERWDGGGYPDGLKGGAIPYLARVLAVADAYGSIISDWPGRRAELPAVALAALRSGAGTQLDPEIAAALVRALSQDAPCMALT